MRAKQFLLTGVLLLSVYAAVFVPFSQYMTSKPYTEKLGLLPRVAVLKVLFADYQELVGASLLNRVLLYFGTLAESSEDPRMLAKTADYPAMSRAIHTALRLDPYNMDGYYFGQSILAWDVRQYRLANELLEYGMKYRSWDWQLPFYAGFNYAYFLDDRKQAAQMYMRAGKLSGSTMFQTLAGRYLQEVGETQLAIDYLRALVTKARDQAVKKRLQLRLTAFEAAHEIELARDAFRKDSGENPVSIEQLLNRGFLTEVPVDPYGGSFYLDNEHNVVSTSKFSFSAAARQGQTENHSEQPSVSE